MSERGIRIRGMKVHHSACLLMIVMLLIGKGELLAVYCAALLWHEGAHALCARCLGFRAPEMEWTPFGAVARIEDWHHAPYASQLLIAMAGPLASFVGAVACLAGFYVVPSAAWALLTALMKAHLYLLLFNLIPVLPLDGGRIVCAFLSLKWNQMTAATVLSRIGVIIGTVCTLTGLWLALRWHVYNVSLVLTGCYLSYSAAVTMRTTVGESLRSLVDKHVLLEKRGSLPVKWMAIDCHRTVRDAIRMLEPGCFHQLVLVQPHTYQVIGQVGEAELQRSLIQNQEIILSDLAK